MVCLTQLLAFAAIALAGLTSAHPGAQPHAKSAAELSQRRLFMAQGKRALASCSSSNSARTLQEQAIARRAAKVQELRQQRRLDASTVLATNHESSLEGITNDTDPSQVFGSNVACVLEPEVTEGPYYVSGEYIRNAITETQEGVPLYAELQFVDVNTCAPVEDLYVDFWHCNATGVYSGVVASSNGNRADRSNADTTFLRGLAPTNSEGIVSFSTIFPGNYRGRAIHIHLITSLNGTVLPSNTYSGGSVSHVGQLFFDQSLITEVEATSPYSTNTQRLTENSDDSIFGQEAASDYDPIFEYVLLGDSVSDGIYAWISIGIDTTQSVSVSAAATMKRNVSSATGSVSGSTTVQTSAAALLSASVVFVLVSLALLIVAL